MARRKHKYVSAEKFKESFLRTQMKDHTPWDKSRVKYLRGFVRRMLAELKPFIKEARKFSNSEVVYVQSFLGIEGDKLYGKKPRRAA